MAGNQATDIPHDPPSPPSPCVPGVGRPKFDRAVTLAVDCICLDLEDGLALNRKAGARTTTVEDLRSLDFDRPVRLVRINPVVSRLEADDWVAALVARPEGLVIPKVESRQEQQWVSRQTGSLPPVIQIETAFGLVNLKQIAAGDPYVKAPSSAQGTSPPASARNGQSKPRRPFTPGALSSPTPP
jgi:citrate lyase beta subunit